MTYLLDVNVLLALSWPGHKFHRTAQQWFARNATRGWATCPMVEAGFIRIITNPAFSPKAVSPKEALQALAISTKHPAHHFWPDDIPIADALAKFDPIGGHQHVTDAYLLGLAIHHGGKLATLDRRLIAILGLGSAKRESVEILDPGGG
jgi:uncharacterized protein